MKLVNFPSALLSNHNMRILPENGKIAIISKEVGYVEFLPIADAIAQGYGLYYVGSGLRWQPAQEADTFGDDLLISLAHYVDNATS